MEREKAWALRVYRAKNAASVIGIVTRWLAAVATIAACCKYVLQ